jgi:hypothetical protein
VSKTKISKIIQVGNTDTQSKEITKSIGTAGSYPANSGLPT